MILGDEQMSCIIKKLTIVLTISETNQAVQSQK